MDKIVEKLDNINKTLEGILNVLSTPENKAMTVLKYAGAGVSALGLLGIVEIVRQWIMGG
jgi:preprotein translocase subunit Sss1